MICQQCQREWPDEYDFCPKCGFSFALVQAQDNSAAVTSRGAATRGDDNLAVTGDVTAAPGATVIFTGCGSTVVIGEAPVEMTAVARESALGRYLQHVIGHNRYLQLQGIRSGGRLVHIELDQIYVTLRATRQRVAETEKAWLAEEAARAPGEVCARERATTETVTVSVEEALAAHRRLALLGDPGSGKTTLLRYLALLYARDLAEGSALVKAKLGLDESGFLPLLMPLRQIGAYLRTHRPTDDGTEGCALLLDFVLDALKGERLALPAGFFDEWLAAGRAIVLLDGLDEVADPDLRRRVSRLVEAFTRAYPACRYAVTSRIVGYTGPVRLGDAYAVTTIRDFSLADVERFLSNWHRLVAAGQMGPGDSAEAYAAAQTGQLLAAVRANERIRDLAINPLMLTVIAMVHRDRVKLPDRRAELYAEAVDVLLGKWEEAKGLHEVPILEDHAFDTGDRRLILQSLALHMHEGQHKEIAAGDLRQWLGEQFQPVLGDWRLAERAVDRFLQIIQERTGLLVARGEGVYAFSHLTFQEYLAAVAVAARDDYVAYTLARAADPWWREVILLEAGYLSLQSKERTKRLVRAIVEQKEEPDLYHNLVLAAECLRDVGSNRVEGNLEAEVQTRLRQEFERPLQQSVMLRQVWRALGCRPAQSDAIRRRAAAVEALARIESGASGAQPAFWRMPHGEPVWINIPEGVSTAVWAPRLTKMIAEQELGDPRRSIFGVEFWMGGDRDYEGQLVHRVYLETFHIARVPVTNAQYRLFTEATGHAMPQCWEEGRPPRGKESHPVVYVSWHDALAYCRWLSKATGKAIRLPTEAEWEKAARGDKDQRAYPWGDSFEATCCNTREPGLGDTTPVGIFPDGASPHGVLDMIGNIWEWCQSLWGAYPYHAADGREDLSVKGSRVLRGSSWGLDGNLTRCAFRYDSDPNSCSGFVGFRVVLVPGSSGL